ncbi:zinc-dependent alcohol dehydrogenase family protein [Alkalihalobacillus hwajinpoensis]|uniref:zinc-dependent alcohol dehydrogenase family protein n=1 Tax=Guptibacillus hwajinpoensis TaxID=208199 RepID=UPI0018837219|nr:zinc-dependent alcohol dehydrogenase family protein [Pseudalkalibacillus hwajinpoensis]MBF0708010.1 zinc-dependent alcohol dehydrogenase family protein [Pseudalkalibacillus hwajinpoensis]
MKAVVINEFGAPSNFRVEELSSRELKAGEVRINVKATSVNPVDMKIRSGQAEAFAPAFPAVLHGDVAGIVEEAYEGSAFKKGDEVYACAGGVKGLDGALREQMIVDQKLVAKKPARLSMKEAAALPLVSITAWEALIDRINVKPGQNVLIHGATGGVGHIAIQIAKSLGAVVYTTASTNEKMKLGQELGADYAINYKETSVEEYVNHYTDGKGFDAVFDTVGGDNMEKSFQAVKNGGDVACIVGSGEHDMTQLYVKSASYHGVLMLVPMLTNEGREHHGEILNRVAHMVDHGILKPVLDEQCFTFTTIGDAHARLESGKTIGKVVAENDLTYS